jgi:hypothetical protein
MNCKQRIDDIIAANSAHDAGFERLLNESPETGMILEFGVSSGNTMKEIQALTNRPIYGFDCWEGLPEDWIGSDGKQVHAKGAYKSDPPDVAEHVTLVSGLFEDSLPKFLEEHPEPIAFVHIDCDIYSSTKYVLTALKDRFVNGSVILFDELAGYTGYETHEYKAFIEFLEKSGYDFEFLGKRYAIAYAFRLILDGVH